MSKTHETLTQPNGNEALRNVFMHGVRTGKETNVAPDEYSPIVSDGKPVVQPLLNDALKNVYRYGIRQGQKKASK